MHNYNKSFTNLRLRQTNFGEKFLSDQAIEVVFKKYSSDRLFTNAQLTHYLALLLNPPRMQYTHSNAFEPCHPAPGPESAP